jgi:hypothetical protein
MEGLTKYITLPVQSDGYGLYIWDAKHNMVMDSARVESPQNKAISEAAATALNAANGHGPAPTKPFPKGFVFPLHRDKDAMDVLDANEKPVLRIRGWGRLQYLGHDEGVKAQEIIGDAFVEAMNKYYSI